MARIHGVSATEGGEDIADDEIGGILAKKRDVAVERTVAIIGGKACLNLLVGQLLQLSSLATHLIGSPSFANSRGWDALAAQWLRPG